MYCSCSKPQKVISEAAGQKFSVCSKNLGGCGNEISSQPYIGIDLAYREPMWDHLINEWIDFEGNNITCIDCSGGGWIMRNYGHGPIECTCGTCYGIGFIE